MQLTKEEAIRRHRMMWNWIAEESIKRKRTVLKSEAFRHFGWEHCACDCWCCQYAYSQGTGSCLYCPIKWPEGSCTSKESPFEKYTDSNGYIEDAKYAKQIAELPERED